MKRLNKKGFTMAELLIVVAIIAVLVAIAIPVFTAQLNKARASTDAANIRSGYAIVASTVLSDNISTDTDYYLQKDSTIATTTTNAYKTNSSATNLPDHASAYIGETAVDTINWTSNQSIKYSYVASTGKITVTAE